VSTANHSSSVMKSASRREHNKSLDRTPTVKNSSSVLKSASRREHNKSLDRTPTVKKENKVTLKKPSADNNSSVKPVRESAQARIAVPSLDEYHSNDIVPVNPMQKLLDNLSTPKPTNFCPPSQRDQNAQMLERLSLEKQFIQQSLNALQMHSQQQPL